MASPALNALASNESDGVIFSSDDVVHRGSEGSARQLGDIGEVPTHLFLASVVSSDLGPPRDVEDEVLGERVEVRADVSPRLRFVGAPNQSLVSVHELPPSPSAIVHISSGLCSHAKPGGGT